MSDLSVILASTSRIILFCLTTATSLSYSKIPIDETSGQGTKVTTVITDPENLTAFFPIATCLSDGFNSNH